MKKKFSNVCLVPCKGMMLVQNILRAIRLELDQERRTYPGVSVEIVFF